MRRAALLLALAACSDDGAGSGPGSASGGPAAEPALRFVDVAQEAGLTEPAHFGRPERPHILESSGAGLALFDAEDDGDLDLLVLDGWRLEGARVAERGRHRFHANDGRGTFSDESARSGLDDDGWGCGVTTGDVDGDGRTDVFVTAFGADSLYRNRGERRFERAPDSPGVDAWSTGAALFDAERDGDLDLYVAGYVAATEAEVLAAEPTLDWRGEKVMFGPLGLPGVADRYFENDGQAGFRDATEEAGLADAGVYYGYGVAALDLDEDLDLDLFVANDSNPNYLFRNDGSGRFEEMGLWSGAALDARGMAQASMGVAAGDVDRDGRQDVVVTNFALENATLYRNRGACLFEDASARAGLARPTFATLEWGAVLGDLDLDGWLDLFLACGHTYPEADLFREELIGWKQPSVALLGEGGRFRDVSADAGPGVTLPRSSRGLAAGDLDGDGDLDLVASCIDDPPLVLRNDSPRRGRWLLVDAPGAVRVELRAGELALVRHAVHGGSFCSASDPHFHFGLGNVERVAEVTAVWPDGERTTLRDVEADRVVEIERR